MLEGQDAESRARRELADLDVTETLTRLGLDPASALPVTSPHADRAEHH